MQLFDKYFKVDRKINNINSQYCNKYIHEIDN